MKNPHAKAFLRVVQSMAMVRQTPFILLGNGLGCLFASWALDGSFTFIERLPIVVVMWMLLIPVGLNWLHLRKRPDSSEFPRTRIVTVYSAVLGLAIAGLMLLYLPQASFSVLIIIIMGCCFMAEGLAAILHIIPWACVCYAVPIILAASALLLKSEVQLTFPVVLFIALMVCGKGWMLYANWQQFVTWFNLSYEKTQLLKSVFEGVTSKSVFLENLSHEIKNPLSSVIGYANLLRDAEGTMPIDLRSYVKNIVTGGEALTTLLNDLLDLAKMDSHSIKLKPVSFCIPDFLHDTVSLVALSARVKNLPLTLTFDGHVPQWQVTDPFRLRQVLLNLLGNAIKFTPTGRIDMVVSWLGDAEKTGGRLRILVADTGPGIPLAERERLFERFSRLNLNASDAPEGTGFGLAISRSILDLMGGTIRLEQAENYGNVFAVEVPTGVSQASVTNEVPTQGVGLVSGGGKRILVADDVLANSELVDLMLTPRGYLIVKASSGMAVFTLCQLQKFDLILMDIAMPGIDGVMATRLLRSPGQLNAATPILALTGHTTQFQLDEFYNSGMNDHLSKPLHLAKLLPKVAQWI